jgi:hypothetical protein
MPVRAARLRQMRLDRGGDPKHRRDHDRGSRNPRGSPDAVGSHVRQKLERFSPHARILPAQP